MYTINNITTTNILSNLHKKASSEKFTIIKGALKSVFRGLRPSDMEEAYIAISQGQGE